MTVGPVPDRARRLAGRLDDLFARDQLFAGRVDDAHRRLLDANARLWTGIDPEGLAAAYGGHPQYETVKLEAAVAARSEILEAGDPLGALQQAHRDIHSAHDDYQTAAEDRRRLAADAGELIARLVDTLVTAGWTEQEARAADVHKLRDRAT